MHLYRTIKLGQPCFCVRFAERRFDGNMREPVSQVGDEIAKHSHLEFGRR